MCYPALLSSAAKSMNIYTNILNKLKCIIVYNYTVFILDTLLPICQRIIFYNYYNKVLYLEGECMNSSKPIPVQWRSLKHTHAPVLWKLPGIQDCQ